MIDFSKICSPFFKRVVNHSALFIFNCLEIGKNNRVNPNGSISIYSDGNLVLRTKIYQKQEKLNFIASLEVIYYNYENIILIDDIGLYNPILEDICKTLNWKYNSTHLTGIKKDYELTKQRLAIMYGIFE